MVSDVMTNTKEALKETLNNHPKLMGFIFTASLAVANGVGTVAAPGGTTTTGP
jgi:hypothetical protein